MLECAETFEQELVCKQIPCSKPQVTTQGQTRYELFQRYAEESNVQCRELWGAQAPGKGGLAAQRALELWYSWGWMLRDMGEPVAPAQKHQLQLLFVI